jgi:DNA-binding NarL/FixJ family response regulator
MPIRILITDDHSVVRKGIRTLLEDEDDMEIVGEAADGDEALALLPNTQPDVMLLDITMPRMSGIDVLKVVSQEYPTMHTLMFSMHNNADYILKSVQYGAAGYLLKDTSQDEILRAVRTIIKGDLYFPPSASSIIIKHFRAAAPVANQEEVSDEKPSGLWNRITSRESQILDCLINGMSSPEIARHFGVSANTVANQRASIMRKANVKNVVDLIRLALADKKR